MVKRVTCVLVIAALAAVSVDAVAGDLKSADEVINKYIEAIGGRKALDAVKTRRITGKNSMGPGMEMPMVIEHKKPNKVRIEFTFQGQTAVQAFDGEIGWYTMPFAGKTDPEKMPQEQIEQFKTQSDADGPLVDYAKKGHKVEFVDKEDLEGTEVYKLKVTKKDESVEYYFIDAEYFLPIKVKGTRKMQGTELEFEVTPSDYKKVGGLMIAHKVTQQAVGMPMQSTLTFDKIEINVDIPDSRFAMPKAEKPKAEESDKKSEESDESDG